MLGTVFKKKETETISPTHVKGSSIMQKLRVPLGFLFGFTYLVFSHPLPSYLAFGLIVALAGLLLRIWSAGHLRKHQSLTISGPYRWTRNPLYLGSFFMGLGFSIASTNPWILLLFSILYLSIYFPVMKREEIELSQTYGTPYRVYRNSVPIFFPIPGSKMNTTKTAFSIQQAMANREYNAVIGYFAVAGILVIKMIWL